MNKSIELTLLCEEFQDSSINHKNLPVENSRYKIQISNDLRGNLYKLLKYIEEVSCSGHTFHVTVDNGNEHYEKSFEIGGDEDEKIEIEDINKVLSNK